MPHRLVSVTLGLAVGLGCSVNGTPSAPTPVAPIASISMTVISDETRSPISGARVTIEKGGVSRTTDAEGKASFDSVPPDTRIKIEAQDYLERITTIQPGNVYGLLGPIGDLPLDFIKEFRFSANEGYANTARPRENRINILPLDETMRSPKILAALERVCGRIRNVGYDCGVYIDTTPPIGTRVSFQYGGAEGTTTTVWSGAGTDHAYTIRGSLLGMENDEGVITKLVVPLGLYHHSYPGGAASKTSIVSDFSAWEKRAIRLYMSRTEPTCYQDTVMLPVPGNFGSICSLQAPFKVQ